MTAPPDPGRPDGAPGSTAATHLAPELVEEIYGELRSLARRALTKCSSNESLNATALVHEAWLRLARKEFLAQADHEHFLAVASNSFRRILIDAYRRRQSLARGGGFQRGPLIDSVVLVPGPRLDLLALDEALTQLGRTHAREAQVVEMRFFGGMSEEQAAKSLGVSRRTAAEDWRFARAWLRRRLGPDADA